MKNILSIIIFRNDYPKAYSEFYKSKGDNYNSLNEAIDDFLNEVGLCVVLSPVYNLNDVFVGCQSYLRIYPNNIFKLTVKDILVIENFKKFNTYDKARKYTTIYTLGFLEEKFNFNY